MLHFVEFVLAEKKTFFLKPERRQEYLTNAEAVFYNESVLGVAEMPESKPLELARSYGEGSRPIYLRLLTEKGVFLCPKTPFGSMP